MATKEWLTETRKWDEAKGQRLCWQLGTWIVMFLVSIVLFSAFTFLIIYHPNDHIIDNIVGLCGASFCFVMSTMNIWSNLYEEY